MACERVIAGLLLLGVSACGPDTYSRTDTVTPAAGDAQARNIRVHAVEPRAGTNRGAEPGSDGVRAVSTFLAYRRGDLPAPGGAEQEDGGSPD